MLDFFKDLFSAMRATAVERVKNPILGAFAFSWIACNWKAILILFFSDSTIENKIDSIKDVSNLSLLFFFPASSALAISIFLPWLSKIVISIQNKPIMSSMDMYRIRNNTILEGRIHTERLRAKAEVAYEREKKELELERQRIVEQIKESQDKILEKDSKIEELTNRNIELENNLSNEIISNNYLKERYDEVMQRGNDLVNEYPYILRSDDSGMIMVDSDSAIHLKELNSKFENNIL